MSSEINAILALMIIGSFLVAITIHEAGHAGMGFWLSRRMGAVEGRQSLHFRPRLSAMGTVFCILLAFQPLFPVGLGWGKRVQLDTWTMGVAGEGGRSAIILAGPLFNFLIGLLAAIIFRLLELFLLSFDTLFAQRLLQVVLVFASVNLCLAIFQLIPLSPLDGYQLLYTLLPRRATIAFAKTARYGLVLILTLFFILPFLAQLTGGSTFMLLRLPSYILSVSFHLIALVVGPSPASFDLIRDLYFA